MGNVSTIPKASPMRSILDKGSDYSYEPMGERKMIFFIVTVGGHSTCYDPYGGLSRVILGPCAPSTITLAMLITLFTNKCMDTKGGIPRWGGDGHVLNWAIGIDMYTLMYIKLMTD